QTSTLAGKGRISRTIQVIFKDLPFSGSFQYHFPLRPVPCKISAIAASGQPLTTELAADCPIFAHFQSPLKCTVFSLVKSGIFTKQRFKKGILPGVGTISTGENFRIFQPYVSPSENELREG